MSIIRMVNPLQKDRKIQVVSHKDFIKILRGDEVESCKEQ